MPVKVRAISEYIFDNAMRKRGDVFDASEDNAHTLVQIGHAEYVTPPNSYAPRSMTADEKPRDEKPPPRSGKNRYPHRAMRAEE